MTTYAINPSDNNVGQVLTSVCAMKAMDGEPPYTGFRLHHIPNWLRLRILRRVAEGRAYGSTAAWWVFESAVQKLGRDWADHVGSAKYGGKLVFVSQPYGLYESAAAGLLGFCRALGLSCLVDPRSDWNAGGTISIIFLPPEGIA